MKRLSIQTSAFLVVSAALVSARADDLSPAERLERARVCFAALDLDCAGREAEALAPAVEALPVADRSGALRLVAEVRLATGRKAEALDALVSLLVLSPDWSPPDGAWPPAWLEVLDQARRLAPDRLPPVIRTLEPGRGVAGRPLEVSVVAEDPSGVGSVTVFPAPGKPEGGGPAGQPDARGVPPVVLSTRDGRTWTGTLPAEWVQPPEVRFFVEARDTLGNGPARLGSPGSPRTIPVAPPPETPVRPVVRQWWFWAAVGLGAAALGAGIYVVARGGGSGFTPSGTPDRGHIRVEVLWPNRSE